MPQSVALWGSKLGLKSFQKGCLKKINQIGRKANPGEIDNVAIEELINLTQTKPTVEEIDDRNAYRQIERGERVARD